MQAKTRKTIYSVVIALTAFSMVFFVWGMDFSSPDALALALSAVVSVAGLLSSVLASLNVYPDAPTEVNFEEIEVLD